MENLNVGHAFSQFLATVFGVLVGFAIFDVVRARLSSRRYPAVRDEVLRHRANLADLGSWMLVEMRKFTSYRKRHEFVDHVYRAFDEESPQTH